MNCRTHRSSTPRTHIAVGSTLPTTSVSGSAVQQSHRLLCALDLVGRKFSVVPSADPAGPSQGGSPRKDGQQSAGRVHSPRWMRPNVLKSFGSRGPMRAGDGRNLSAPTGGLYLRANTYGAGSTPPTSFLYRPEIGRDYPLNLSISLSGGKETNKDSLSNGE